MKNLICILSLLLSAVSLYSFSGKGDGTQEVPYEITNIQQLQEIADNNSASYILKNNIDAEETKNWNIGDHDDDPETADEPMGFKPILFSGILNGQNHYIKGLYINRRTQDTIGLFSKIGKYAQVLNLGLRDVDITGFHFTGGITGYNYGTISCSYVTGSVRVEYRGVGGISGGTHNGSVVNSYVRAYIRGSEYVGGFDGGFYNYGTFKNCYYSGYISAAAPDKAGCFFGWKGEAYNCFTESIYKSDSINKSEQEMKTKSTFTDAGWDFENIWSIDPDINDGYPHLQNAKVVSVNDEYVSVEDILIYPNPVTEQAIIKVRAGRIGNCELILYDILGNQIRHIHSCKLESEILILDFNTVGLQNGIYYLAFYIGRMRTIRPVIVMN